MSQANGTTTTSRRRFLTATAALSAVSAVAAAPAVAVTPAAVATAPTPRLARLKAKFDMLWAEYQACADASARAEDLYDQLKPEPPDALIRTKGDPDAPDNEEYRRRDWRWCAWSLRQPDAPPNAAELLPIAEAYEAAVERAKEVSQNVVLDEESTERLDETENVARIIMRSRCRNAADFALKIDVWNTGLRERTSEGTTTDDDEETHGWLEVTPFRLLDDARKLLGCATRPRP